MRTYEPRVEIFKGKRDWRFRVVASNGQIIAASEGYATKRNAQIGAKGLIKALRKKPLCITTMLN
jgi:uncharacterized protein YegP (UPF0339 family)